MLWIIMIIILVYVIELMLLWIIIIILVCYWVNVIMDYYYIISICYWVIALPGWLSNYILPQKSISLPVIFF